MLRTLCRTAVLSLAVLACLAVEVRADHNNNNCPSCLDREHGNPDLFASYYVPGNCGAVPAQMYLAPLPAPPVVGYTYITYQPFMPHEMLYPHHRTYHRYYDGGRGLTRTSVRWYNPPVISQAGTFLHHFRVAR